MRSPAIRKNEISTDSIGRSWRSGQKVGASFGDEGGHLTFRTDDSGQFSDFIKILFGRAQD